MILRAVHPRDTDRLLAFYQGHPSPFLLPRPTSEFEKSVALGQFFAVTDGERLVAAAGIFDYAEDAPFVELAETFVTDEVQGFGLQRLFFRLRAASVVLFQGPAVGITTAIDPGNAHSLRSMQRQHFERWETPIPAAYASCPTCPRRSEARPCCCDFYVLPLEAVRRAVTDLLAETATGVIRLENKANAVLEIECAAALLHGERRAALEDFARGATW